MIDLKQSSMRLVIASSHNTHRIGLLVCLDICSSCRQHILAILRGELVYTSRENS